MIKIAIGLPVAEIVEPGVYFNHIVAIGKWVKNPEYEIKVIGIEKMKITQARNLIINRALELGCDYLLFIDSDHKVPLDMLPKLLETGPKCGMVSGLINKRGYPYETVAFKKDKNGSLNLVEIAPGNQIYEVDACAMGCTLINLQKIQLLQPPYFTDGHFRHDINLCLRFKSDAGAKSYVDARVEMIHLGDRREISPRNATMYRQQHIDEMGVGEC
jgi:hypothetical protein